MIIYDPRLHIAVVVEVAFLLQMKLLTDFFELFVVLQRCVK
jgi:hypothetical protein